MKKMIEQTITTEQRIANAIIWIEALKSGEYKKGIGALGVETEGEWSYCCLGVGCKALHIDETYERGYSYKLMDQIGLATDIGYFDNHNDCLTNCNDLIYKDDTDFTNMVRVILENIDDLFIEPVAEGLKKHYGL
jgi:hypothetical protein